MKIRDTYHFLPFPYISKTGYKTWKSCKYKFKRLIMDGVDNSKNKVMAEGTTLHYIYYIFFDMVDFDVLYKLKWAEDNGTRDSEVYQYFYSLIMGYLDDNIPNKHMLSNIKNFSMLEENYWVFLRTKFKAKAKIKKYFFPLHKEMFMREDDQFKIFGTADRIMREGNKIIVCDYKTGNVPSKVREEIRDTEYTKVGLGHYTVEGNFYVLLYMLTHEGYIMVRDKKGRLAFSKNGVIDPKAHKNYDYAFIYTGEYSPREPTYYVARKSASITSMRSIINNLSKIRDDQEWTRNPNIMKCRWCPLYLSECRSEVPIEIFGNILGGEDTAQESVHDNERGGI